MAKLEILEYPDERLRTVAKPVERFDDDLRGLVDDMLETMYDAQGQLFEEELTGLHAICLQHEMDHLNGKLFVDYLSPLKRRMVSKKLEKQRKVAAQKPARAIL
jgi:peptide deformylase